MYIEEIRLHNIRSYKNAILKFSKGINILIGENNSGKSTILKSVYTIQNRNHLKISDIRKPIEKGNITITINEINELDKESFITASLTEQSYYNQSIIINTILRAGGQPNVNSSFSAKENIEAISEEGQFKHFGRSHFGVGNHTFQGIFSSEAQKNFVYPFLSQRKNNSFASRIDLKDIHQVSDDFKFLIAKIKKLSNPGHNRNEEFLALCQDILGFKIGLIPEENQQENLGVFITDTDLISINQMGDGVIHIIGLIAMLLTEDSKLYLIEELENDLHPEALKALLELIIKKSTSNQFIISTHSNIVLRYLGSIQETKIFETSIEFEKLNSFNSIKVPTSTAIEITNTPEDRMNLILKLGYEPWDFELYKAYLILEESSAETIIRDFLIPNFAPSLLNQIRTIAAGGISDIKPRFYAFLRLFVFIHANSIYYKKAWILADGDDAGKSCIKEIQEKFSSWPKNHFINTSKSNFEDFYPKRFESKFNEILKLSNKEEKRNKKRELLQEVLNWVKTDPISAKREFESSASDIIKILKDIETQLNS